MSCCTVFYLQGAAGIVGDASNTTPCFHVLQGTASMPGGTLPLGGLSSSGLAGGFGSDAGMTSSRLASSR